MNDERKRKRETKKKRKRKIGLERNKMWPPWKLRSEEAKKGIARRPPEDKYH